jgi:hypothetical protein
MTSLSRLSFAVIISSRLHCVHDGLTPDLPGESLSNSNQELSWNDPGQGASGSVRSDPRRVLRNEKDRHRAVTGRFTQMVHVGH